MTPHEEMDSGSAAVSRRAVAAALQDYARSMSGLLALKTRYRASVCPLSAVVAEIAPGQRLYDVGCGAGSLLYLATQVGGARDASGYDISPAAIAAARNALAGQPDISVQFENAGFVPELKTFDVITIVDVVHHVPPKQQASFLQAIAQAMRPGAKLVVLDIDAARRARAWANRAHDLLLAREWTHPTTAPNVSRWLTDAGLEVRPARFYSTLWYGHYLLVARKPEVASGGSAGAG